MSLISQIQLGEKGYLEITDDVAVPLNFAVAEIQDISKRQGGYSKTIQLPGTPNNNKLLGHLYDVNIADGSFNQNIREKCIILQNGVPAFNGFLQLLDVVKTSPSQENPDEIVTYNVRVQDDTGDFYSALSDKLLEDLTGYTQYNHTYTLSSILATSAHTYQNVYMYPMTYNQNNEYHLNDFQVAIYALDYWTRIFKEAGYSWEWNSLTACSMDKLVVPYNGDRPLPNLGALGARASSNSPVIFSNLNGNNYPLIFDNDTTLPNYDSGSTYNTSTGKWTSSYFGQVNVKTRYVYELYLSCPVAMKFIPTPYISYSANMPTSSTHYGTAYLNVSALHHIGNLATWTDYPLSNAYISSPTLVNQFTNGYSEINFNSGLNLLDSGTTTEFTTLVNVVPNQQIQNWVEGYVNNYVGKFVTANYVSGVTFGYSAQTGTAISVANLPKVYLKITPVPTDYNSNYMKFEPVAQLGEGMQINVPDFIPKKVKQKDFISGIVKLFNLYITPSKDRDKHLIVETRNEFYDNGGTQNWTKKLISGLDTKIQFLPDLQNKKLVLTYKQDKDIYNTDYFNQTSEVYGQLEYTFESEWVKETKTIETLFSPTPLEENYFNMVVPTIDSKQPKNNIRLLYYNGWIPTNQVSGSTWTYRSTTGYSFTTSTYTTYPFCGDVDNPFNPTKSILYAMPDYLYYDSWDTVTNNNLYNLHWSRFINQIETGKLMTAKFKLNEYDILNLNFRDKIYINDTYWFINKIIDYDANSKEGLTTVELINVDEGIKFTSSIQKKSTNPIKATGGIKKYINNEETYTNRFANNSFGGSSSYVEVLGQDNIIQAGSNTSIIMGNDNNVAGNRLFVIGDGNTIQGNDVVAIGLTGTTIRNSNVTVLGSTPIININFINAGRDEVLNPFSITKLVNKIDAGRDSIRPLGSQSIEARIDAGKETII